MSCEVLDERVVVHVMDPGVAVTALDGDAQSSESVLAFAHHTSHAAVRAAAALSDEPLHVWAMESRVTHLRPSRGPLEAAAIVERALTEDLAHDIRRTGRAHARVAVAVVDALGDAVAFGSFDFCVGPHEEEAADAEPNEPGQCPQPFLFSTLARNTAN